ncbi:hypothetical protein HanRHA438_Chr15g0719451 [Helianthus annuus]|nr:hypothetical protein HanIR_Chr15g0769351 [Helianthus annuus]KAJ0649692.1 hypothetical protein HanLR1_Chr15g0587211 [Helianthus annuus]KAJ0653478.1 hypothetical protein HanOQP8_Chr15g0584031 [Helianthus annuus]KAJ0694203.1 hypothetical protein HanPI659440_Chr15g0606151 [Helianthus annuus]KAJ0845952.1 hypothetical protein HanRHA438_Chr15g0719451 [Helianthus annuus]
MWILVNYSVPTLGFPSISITDFQFNIEKASDIIVETLEEFVNKFRNGRLVLVDISRGSKILSLVKSKAAVKTIDLTNFFTFEGDITKLHSRGGLHCNVIAIAANCFLRIYQWDGCFISFGLHSSDSGTFACSCCCNTSCTGCSSFCGF